MLGVSPQRKNGVKERDVGAGRGGADLVTSALSGQRRAFSELYQRQVNRLYRACVGLTGDPTDAQDLVQQVFTQAFRKLDTYDGSCQVSTWLYGIAVRLAANHRRGKRRRERFLARYRSGRAGAKVITLDDRAARHQQVAQALSLLDDLDDKKRTAFLLYHIEGLQLPEIAAATGVSSRTAFERLKAARRILTKKLDKRRARESST